MTVCNPDLLLLFQPEFRRIFQQQQVACEPGRTGAGELMPEHIDPGCQ